MFNQRRDVAIRRVTLHLRRGTALDEGVEARWNFARQRGVELLLRNVVNGHGNGADSLEIVADQALAERDEGVPRAPTGRAYFINVSQSCAARWMTRSRSCGSTKRCRMS